jgi:hypothetical protein
MLDYFIEHYAVAFLNNDMSNYFGIDDQQRRHPEIWSRVADICQSDSLDFKHLSFDKK